MKALKLDASYRPVEVIDALEALVLCIVGKAKAIENYSKEICSPSKSFKIPAVIVLKNIVRYKFGGIMCNRKNIIWRDQNTCQYCAKTFPSEKLTVGTVVAPIVTTLSSLKSESKSYSAVAMISVGPTITWFVFVS